MSVAKREAMTLVSLLLASMINDLSNFLTVFFCKSIIIIIIVVVISWSHRSVFCESTLGEEEEEEGVKPGLNLQGLTVGFPHRHLYHYDHPISPLSLSEDLAARVNQIISYSCLKDAADKL